MRRVGWLVSIGFWLAVSACGGRSIEDISTASGGASAGASTSTKGGSGGAIAGAPSSCGGASPSCPPSCVGLAKTCGPNRDGDCCASNLVPGGTFCRANVGACDAHGFPATVSDFRLDNYEITVGRFRKFMTTYTPNLIAQGAGRNPNNASDTGWDASWNATLPANAAALEAKLKSYFVYATWSNTVGDAVAESRPITALSWFEAEAFCIWDGGRLPTEAEWAYAAAGGAEQRPYPWGSVPPGPNATLAVYDCRYGSPAGAASCTGIANIAPVGSSAAGNGKWGQADLAGNIWEWVQDWYNDPYGSPCVDCADLTNTSGYRVIRGGAFDNPNYDLPSSVRDFYDPGEHFSDDGARCARAP